MTIRGIGPIAVYMRKKGVKSALKSSGSVVSVMKAESSALASQIAELMAKKTRLDAAIASYEGPPPKPLAGKAREVNRKMSKNNRFYGLALPEAVTKQLATYSSPKLPQEIWAGMDGQYPSTSKDPVHGTRWALQRRARSHGDVMMVGEGKWAMSAWYSEEERKKIKDSLGPMAGRDRATHIAKTKAAVQAMKARGIHIGRKEKMTPEVISKLRQLIENGLSVADACERVGVKPSTFYAHRTKGTFPGLKVLKQSKDSDEPDLLNHNPTLGPVN